VDLRILYRAKVRQQHSSYVVRKWFGLYAWFWFHTEFWLEPLERRPYTYIMQDWIYPHMNWFRGILVCFNALMGYLTFFIHPAVAIPWVLTSWLSAHLIWGGGWIPGQQEWPTVIEHADYNEPLVNALSRVHKQLDLWTDTGKPRRFTDCT